MLLWGNPKEPPPDIKAHGLRSLPLRCAANWRESAAQLAEGGDGTAAERIASVCERAKLLDFSPEALTAAAAAPAEEEEVASVGGDDDQARFASSRLDSSSAARVA